MDAVAELSRTFSAGEGCHFGVPEPDPICNANPMVLTAREDIAGCSQSDSGGALEGVFQLEHPNVSGNISIVPGRVAGARRIGVCLKNRDGSTGLRLDAELRSSWVAAMCGAHIERVERAAALAAAMVQLAAIPGQRTVALSGDPATPEDVPSVAVYAALLGTEIIEAA